MNDDLASGASAPSRTRCPDCAVDVGAPHSLGCDVARCHLDGSQRLGCESLRHILDGVIVECDPDVWTGMWPGEAECREYGLMLTADIPDLNKLMLQGRWDIRLQRWVWPR